MYLSCVIALLALFLACGESQVSLNRTSPSGIQSVCPNQMVVFTCRVTGSTTLSWTSTEYIGPGDVVEFITTSANGSTTTLINGGVAVVTQVSITLLESQLRIVANENSSISCIDDGGNSVTANLQVYNNVIPGKPAPIAAAEIPILGDSCAILVNWNPPTNIPLVDIDHYILRETVNGVQQDTSTPSTLATFRLNQCPSDNNIFINVAAVDRCGREGPISDEIQPNLLPPLDPVTESPTTRGTVSTTDSTNATTTTTTNQITPSVSGISPAVSGVISGAVVIIVVVTAVLLIPIIILVTLYCRLRRNTRASNYEDVHNGVMPRGTALPWTGYEQIYVKFMNTPLLTESNWTIGDGQAMNTTTIISYANRWRNNENSSEKIPLFVEATHGQTAQIRVKFNNSEVCSSELGTGAQKVKATEPTMRLDLQTDCPSDKFKQYVVIQMFGHALGLGYEHQRSNFWECIKPFTDTKKMKNDLQMTDAEFTNVWSKTNSTEEYDPDSVMNRWFDVEWLTHGYSRRDKVKQDRGKLGEGVANALLGVHKHHQDPPTEPSPRDIQVLEKLYEGPEETSF